MAHGQDSSPAAAPIASLSAADAAVDTALAHAAPPTMVVPLWNRILDARSLRASTAGIAIALVLIALVALREALLGHFELAITNPNKLYSYVSVVEAMMVGYLVAARASVARVARTALDSLADMLDLSPVQLARLRAEIGTYRLYRFQAAGYAAALVAISAPFLIRDNVVNPWAFAEWTPEFALRRTLAPFVGWLFGTYLLATFREAKRISDLASHIKSIDLFGCEMLAPFSRFGLHVAFQSVGLVSVITLMIAQRGFNELVVILVVIAAASAAAGLLLPLRGLRDRIADEKTRELACCREALRRARDALVAGKPGATDPGRISEVVAYKQLVESIDEWPIDTPTILRACGYVGIPVISWFSGTVAPDALVGVFEALFH